MVIDEWQLGHALVYTGTYLFLVTHPHYEHSSICSMEWCLINYICRGTCWRCTAGTDVVHSIHACRGSTIENCQ